MRKCKRWMRRSLAWLLCLVMTVGMLSTAAVADGEKTNAVGSTVKLSAVTEADKTKASNLLKGVTITSLSDYMWRDEEVVPYFESTIKISNAGDWGKYKVLVKWEMKLPTEAETEWRYAGTDGVTPEPKPQEPGAYYVKQESDGPGPHRVTYVGVTRKMSFTSDTARKQIGNGMEHRCTVYVVKVNSDNTYEEIASKSTNAAKILLAVNYEKANYGWYSIGHGMDYGYYSTTEFVQGGTKADGTKKPAQQLYDENSKYSFLGWYNGSQPYDFTKPVSSILTLTPEFGTVVSFDTKGIGDAIAPANVVKGKHVSKPAITGADDYNLVGWYKDAAFTQEYDFNKTIEANFPGMNNSYKAITLYAKLEKKITYLNVKLHLYYNGHGLGKPDQTITVVEGSTLAETCAANEVNYGKFLNPVCNGSHTFMGWFTDAAFKNSFDVNNTTFDKTITDLHALWGFEVTFDVGNHGADAIEPQVVKDGGTVTQPDAPVATDDYTFIGWTLNGSAYNFSSEVNDKITLVANWKKNKQVIDLEKIENFTYDGKTHSVSIVDENGNALSGIESKNYNLTIKKDNATVTSIKDAGKYTVTLTLTEAGKQNYELKGNKTSIEVKFTVSPKVVERINWTTGTLTYNADNQAPEATVAVFEGDKCTVTVSGQKKEVGANYTATAVSLSNNNYSIGTSTVDVTKKFSIEQKEITINWNNETPYKYNGTPQGPTFAYEGVYKVDEKNVVLTAGYTRKGSNATSTHTSVGEYTAKVTMSGTASKNYKLPVNSTVDFKIVQNAGTIEWKVTGNQTIEYGNTLEVTYDKHESDGTVTVSSNKTSVATVSAGANGKVTVTAVGVGEAEITAKLASTTNYSGKEAKFKVVVTQKTLTLTWSSQSEFTFNGENQWRKVTKVEGIVSWQGKKDDVSVNVVVTKRGSETELEEYSGVGKYTSVAKLAGKSAANYKLPANASQNFEIKPATTTIEELKDLELTYGEIKEFRFKTNSDGTVTITSADESIAKVFTDTDGKAKIQAVGNGKTKITVSIADSDNYKANSKTITVNVKKKKLVLQWSNTSKTYDSKELIPSVKIKTELVGEDKVNVEISVTGFASGKYPVHAGQYKATASLSGDQAGNYVLDASSSMNAWLTIDQKPVHIEWTKTEFEFDATNHIPEAQVVKSEIEGDDICVVNVSRESGCNGYKPKKEAHHAQATGITNYIEGGEARYSDYKLAPDTKKTTEFFVRNVAKSVTLDTTKYSVKEYIIGVDDTEIDATDLDLSGLKLIKHFEYEDKDITAEEIDITPDMLSFEGAKLGEQNVTVIYKDEKLGTVEAGTFKIVIKKQLEVTWSEESLVYNGKPQAPQATIDGVNDAEGIVEIVTDPNAKDATIDETACYIVSAKVVKDDYVLDSDGATVVFHEYTIEPQEVTLTGWTADNAANVANWKGTKFLFWYDENAHCPIPVFDVTPVNNEKIYELTVAGAGEEGAPSNIGYYSVSMVISNSNYCLVESEISSTTSFAILEKVDATEFTIRVPQCGETVTLYSPVFNKVMSLTMPKAVMTVETVDGVAAQAIAWTGAVEDETDYTWAVLVNGIEGVTSGYGFLLPQVVVDAEEAGAYIDQAYLNAINQNMPSLSKDEKTKSFQVEGDKVYTVVAVLAVDGDVAAIDTAAIAKAIKVASDDENVAVTIQHVIVGTNAIVVFADITAVHNYTEFAVTTEPTEDTVGEKSRNCEYAGNVTHVDTAEIDKLIPESIEVIVDDVKTDYLVNEELDVRNLKIKVTYTVGSTAEKPVTKDMVTNFDSSKVVTGKAVTVEYKGLTDDYKINVAKKQSSVKLSGDDTVTKVYGDKPFDVEFETENGTAVLTSSDESVAKIVDGQVVIVGAGTAKITAKIAETDEVTGSEDSFDLIVNKKVVGLTWSNLEFTEDGQEHVPSAEATGVLEGDSCTVTVEGATKKAGETIATATKLSNDNYALPEDASVKFKINEKKTAEPKDVDPVQKGETEPEKKDEPEKVEPEKTEPEKTEPEKTEPEKTEPEKKDEVVEVVLIEIGDKVKRNYIVNDKIDLTDVTITVKTADGTKVVPVTEDMVTNFDTSKPSDNVEVTITYKGTSKQFNITVADLIYYTIEGNLAPASGENLVLVVHRSVHDELTFSLYLGTYIDGVLVPQTALKTWSGSLNMIMYAEYIKTLSAGKHNIEIRFADGKALAEITVAKVETNKKDDSQTEKNTPKTADTSSMVLWFIILVAAALAFVATRVYANKRRSVE
ncbi:MAG: InlB B-repeat-containing protein [Lachnospiraceae bacterium]|nr:InlB B-repeat-containing protein [Lachnospiraceae bacterium]